MAAARIEHDDDLDTATDAIMYSQVNEASTMVMFGEIGGDRKSTRLNSSHGYISYAVFCLKKTTELQSRLHIG